MNPSIVILTGAGISAESGVKTFRDADGLWEGHRVEEVATPEAFGRNAATVHRFYNQRRQQLLTVAPNPAHEALARLERDYQGEVTLVTQNVDDLHERAGSKKILHMHGEILRKKCIWCDAKSDCVNDLGKTDPCETCRRDGGVRPDIVWFGEMPYHLDEIDQTLGKAEIFIAIGTSGHVYPAAGFVKSARSSGAWCIEINKDQTTLSDCFDDQRVGLASIEVPRLVEELLQSEKQ